MIGKRIRKADILARKRFAYFHPEDEYSKEWASQYRKNNVKCSCWMCCNPRHSESYNEVEKLTRQERTAPTIKEEWY